MTELKNCEESATYLHYLVEKILYLLRLSLLKATGKLGSFDYMF